MKTTLAILAATALALSAAGAQAAQHGHNPPGSTQQGDGQTDGMMDRDDMNRGGGMMGQGGMGHGMMVTMMMAMMDTDGDGALSLEEVQAVHARMFAMIDADGDGTLNAAEIQGFMRGGGMPAADAQ